MSCHVMSCDVIIPCHAHLADDRARADLKPLPLDYFASPPFSPVHTTLPALDENRQRAPTDRPRAGQNHPSSPQGRLGGLPLLPGARPPAALHIRRPRSRPQGGAAGAARGDDGEIFEGLWAPGAPEPAHRVLRGGGVRYVDAAAAGV